MCVHYAIRAVKGGFDQVKLGAPTTETKHKKTRHSVHPIPLTPQSPCVPNLFHFQHDADGQETRTPRLAKTRRNGTPFRSPISAPAIIRRGVLPRRLPSRYAGWPLACEACPTPDVQAFYTATLDDRPTTLDSNFDPGDDRDTASVMEPLSREPAACLAPPASCISQPCGPCHRHADNLPSPNPATRASFQNNAAPPAEAARPGLPQQATHTLLLQESPFVRHSHVPPYPNLRLLHAHNRRSLAQYRQ